MGQLSLLSKREPIEKVLEKKDLSEDTRRKLELVLEARSFAETELGFALGDSYTSYVETGRPYVVWNVIVSPEFSLDPLEFCFPIAGCVTYRGYFDKSMAIKEAEKYRSEGHDVFVGGVTAYSTLGWFDDPVLDTFFSTTDLNLVALLFHESAHQLVYRPGDTTFNESFASTVEIEAVRRWLLHRGAIEEFEQFQSFRKRQKQFIDLVEGKKKELEGIYQSQLEESEKRQGKERWIKALRRDYNILRQSWGEHDDYRNWVDAEINNARLSTINTYYLLVPQFEALLRSENGDLARFIERAKDMKSLPGKASIGE